MRGAPHDMLASEVGVQRVSWEELSSLVRWGTLGEGHILVKESRTCKDLCVSDRALGRISTTL